jgi:ribosomal-protein-alanine N-acetyltransferase
MTQLPTIETERLVLRPFTLADAPAVQRLAGERDIASTTLSIPHPYPDEAAKQWIGKHQDAFSRGEALDLAVTRRSDGALVGAIGLRIEPEHARAELGYWIGKPYWGRGYCTEAAAAVVRYGFDALELNRIHACHLLRNPASGRVMQKIGMVHEGCLRGHVRKWGQFEDLALYGILRAGDAAAGPHRPAPGGM